MQPGEADLSQPADARGQFVGQGTAESPPSAAVKKRADNMGYPGIEPQNGNPGSDNNWISCYELFS